MCGSLNLAITTPSTISAQRDHEVRQLHRRRFLHPISVQRLQATWHCSSSALLADGRAEDEQSAEEGRNRGAERIECLRQIQSAGCGARRAEHGDVGIGRNLQRGDAGGENDQRSQKQRERRHARGRNKQQRAQPMVNRPATIIF